MVAVHAGGRVSVDESAIVLVDAFDTDSLSLSAPVGGSTNTIRNGAEADGFTTNVLGGLKP